MINVTEGQGDRRGGLETVPKGRQDLYATETTEVKAEKRDVIVCMAKLEGGQRAVQRN